MSVEVLTFGCRLNAVESEAMRGLAERAGHRGAVLVNTCAVSAEAEKQARQAIRAAHRRNPAAPILVTGCASQIAPGSWASLPGVARVVPNPEKLRPEAWARGRARQTPQAMARPPAAAGAASARTRAFVQVQNGCDHACTFCVIPQGRGPSTSVPLDTLALQLRTLVEGGHREAVLTGVDIASYGADLAGRPALGATLRRLFAAVPDLPRLRLSSLDPVALDDDFLRLLATEPRLMPHLHLSLQHGSDLILKRMRRRHRRADALALARRARQARPDIALGADLIAGFPTETDAHHRETLNLVEAMGLSFLHFFPYSERPNTAAARMPPVPMPLRRERAARLRGAGAAAASRFYASRIGREETVLFEAGNRGHTEHFAPLRLPEGAPAVPRGALRLVRVQAATADGLIAALPPHAGEAR
jgi:threonylcarbamoyladenosine tRNA methylthiotransferase MtaB